MQIHKDLEVSLNEHIDTIEQIEKMLNRLI